MLQFPFYIAVYATDLNFLMHYAVKNGDKRLLNRLLASYLGDLEAQNEVIDLIIRVRAHENRPKPPPKLQILLEIGSPYRLEPRDLAYTQV